MSDRSRAVSWNTPPVETLWTWSREQLRAWQLAQLNQQLQAVLPTNQFYRDKFGSQHLQLACLEQLTELPLTSKQELVDSARAAPGAISAHHTFAPHLYSRMHRTSGTTGQPLIVLDTAEDWRWWSATWQHVLQAASVTDRDRVFMAFSFGPFVGFWSAHQACVDRGATVIPGGGLSTLARLEFMQQSAANVVCCTPSYALHMAHVAKSEKISLHAMGIQKLIVAGEAGGSVSTVRERIEQAWNARVIDHSGATEIGPWGFGWSEYPGLHIIESSFIAEFLPLAESTGDNRLAELILTSIGRYGAPVFRYRTGDIVRISANADARCRFQWLPEGVVGRADNMVTIRGVNVFPSSIDSIVRELPQVNEYQVQITRVGEMDQLYIDAETDPVTGQQLEKAFSSRLGLRIPVKLVAPNTLPRSELKSRRWVDRRGK